MPSARVQRRIDGLLDQAEEAIAAMDWSRVRQAVEGVLAVDAENADAQSFLAIAERASAVDGSPDAATVVLTSGQPTVVPTDATPVSAPTSFANDRYQVSKFLGEGGKKRVYQAHDTLLDREVAFALIKTEGFDQTSKERISREAQAMGRLGVHPNIVAVLDLGEDDGSPYMVTELMGGGDIEGVLEEAEENRLSLERTIEIGKAVCEGLEFAHARGIVHRDLKPGNVWLTEDGVAKIGDFGLAVMTDRSRLTREGMMIGTVSYMPPEQATGGEITPKADLYSLGAMLYEMVTGRPPFLGDEEIAIIGQHINTPPVAPTWHNSTCPRPLEALIMRMLAKDPSERPESAQDVFNALDAIDLTARGESVEQDATSLESLAGGVFVGRQAEMDTLKAALEDVLGGRGRLVTLVGEPGIGKTRTSEELATYAGLRGAQVLWGRCYETGGQPPYWPWVQAIRSYVREIDADELRRQMGSSASVVAEIVTDIKDRFPDLQPPQQLDDPDSARFRLFDSIASFLKSASQSKPLVIVLDDLHWSDRPSLALLEFMAREIRQSRVLLLCTYRDMELNRRHPLTITLGDLAREPLYERVLLRGLSEQDVARFIEIVAGFSAPTGLAATVHRHTEGNPLFVTEVVRELVQSGDLAEKRGSTDSAWSVRIPEGVRDVIGRRLDRLSERANQMLTIAAVIGRDFRLDALKALSEESTEGQLLDALDDALDAKIIEELTDSLGHYQFTHALMQETLTGELSLTRRVRLHARIAEAMEGLYGEKADEHATELAHHFGEAQAILGVERFLEYALLAGNGALASLAYDEAESIYRSAVGSVDGGPTTHVQAELFAGLGRACAAQARIDEAVSNLNLAFDYHATAGNIDAAAAAAETAFPPYAGLMSGAIDLCERALELVPAKSHQAGRLLARHGQLVSMHDSNDERSTESFNAALEIARENHDTVLEARILAHRTFAGIYQHALDSSVLHGLDDASFAIERARDSGDLLSEVEASYSGCLIAALNGDLSAATTYSTDLLKIAEQLRDRSWMGRALNAKGIIANATGDFEQSAAHDERGASLWVSDDARILANRINREAELGSPVVDETLARLREIANAQTERATLELAYYAFSKAIVAHISGDQRHLADAKEVSSSVLEVEEVTPLVDWLARCTMAIVAVEENDDKLARDQYQRLLPMSGKWLFLGGDRLLALLARTFGDTEEAIRLHEDALKFGRSDGYRVDLAWSCSEYAETLLDRDEPGDREKAIELQDEALVITQELGMRPLTERILARREILRA